MYIRNRELVARLIDEHRELEKCKRTLNTPLDTTSIIISRRSMEDVSCDSPEVLHDLSISISNRMEAIEKQLEKL